MSDFKQFAIIGPTASGKTALAVSAAQKHNAHILSLDSLSIYKEIDIVSAKPDKEKQGGIIHFGIDYLNPDETFDVTTYIDLYKEVHALCQKETKNLIIVGGTGFYLKMLLEGISKRPALTDEQNTQIDTQMQDSRSIHAMLMQLDPDYMHKIKTGDTYRIQKALEIYLSTGKTPSYYFKENPPVPIIKESLPIYEIVWDRKSLRERINVRTEGMIRDGLIDEVIALEKKYTRAPHYMKAIGIKETLMYLDGIYDKKALIEKIAINTGRLAKRQMTFNRSQFGNVLKGSFKMLERILL